MNIVVRTYSGKIVTRPDTSWKSRDDSFYAPEFVKKASISPIMFLRICRAGKCIAEKFADRYYDRAGYGFLIYAENLIDGSEDGFSSASCLDHTSFFPDLNLDRDLEGSPSADFEIRDGENSALCSVKGLTYDGMNSLIELASGRCLLRASDIVAEELGPRIMLDGPSAMEINSFLNGTAYQKINVIL